MSRRVSVPKIDPRKAEQLLLQLRRMVPHYTKEWPAKDNDDPGVALLKIFSSIAEGVINRLNRAPDRNFLAFLDMLGIRLLPATPARVPVTFRLANGTEAAVLIPTETQVSAPPKGERQTDLPFETIEPLSAIPAKLTDLFVVDPEKDHIYKPHLGFLGVDQAATELPSLRVTAFSAQNSKFLQLEPPDQVKKGEFLRIDHAVTNVSSETACPPPSDSAAGSSKADHLVVFDAKGSIVTVTDPLPRDYVEGTEVKRVTDFELFEARNWQEHVLYLGHADYFAIKSEAQIELTVKHAGATTNLESLTVIWEFFGDTATSKEEEWRRFEVELDGTLGFRRNGAIVLNKPAGEIKEKSINGQKNRWIRARLDGPLPAVPARSMPTIESVLLKVSTAGKGIPPDQAFHNDTPLTVQPRFFPFGPEPRLFDRFSVASEEAFSKVNAEIELTFKLDPTQLLASPAAVFAQKKLRVFGVGVAGKLLEFQIDPTVPAGMQPTNLESPPDIRLTAGSIPAVITDSHDTAVGVFVKGDDQKIHMRRLPTLGDKEEWKTLLATPGALQFDPAVIQKGDLWRLFVIADNRLYVGEMNSATPNLSAWGSLSVGPKIDSSPFVVMLGNSEAVFITGADGATHMFKGGWTTLTPIISPNVYVPEYVAAENARPFVRPRLDEGSVFLRNKQDELIVLDTVPGNARPLGRPSLQVGVASDPFGSSFAGDDRIYVRGTDGHLWSTSDGTDWLDHQTPSDVELAGHPFVITYPKTTGDFTSIFSSSKKNALAEYRVSDAVLGSGAISVGPKRIVELQEAPRDAADFIHILRGPGSGSSEQALRKIVKRQTSQKFVVLETELDASPTTATVYALLHEIVSGAPRGATSTTLTLQPGHRDEVKDGDYLLVESDRGKQFRRIPRAPAPGSSTVTIEPGRPWDRVPGVNDTYRLLRVDADTHEHHVAFPSATRAVLEPTDEPDHYEGRFLRITDGPGKGVVGRKIVQFVSDSKKVELEAEFGEPPDSRSLYQITASSVPAVWFVHRDPDQVDLRPELSWEYWNGRGWVALIIKKDSTDRLLTDGSVFFTVPNDIAKTEVAGQENYWIRSRIVGGDYGRELFTFKDGEIKVVKDPIRPPEVTNLTITYKLIELKPPQACLTFNNLSYLDQTAANITDDKHFKPFLPLEDQQKTIYFGFDREFAGGPVGIYFAAKELQVDERNKPELAWEFASENTWKSMSADDGTKAFTRREFVRLVVPLGLQNTEGFGKALYWLRARLSKGEWQESPLFKGVFLNTVAALQARTVRNEILGSSTGVKNQKYRFQHVPVIKNEEVRVREVLTETEQKQLVKERGEDAVRAITDQRGEVIQTWIRWIEVTEFFDSKPDSRHYRLDRHTGEIEFGNGVRGRIPPIGADAIQAFAYQTGGGAAGNVPAGDITSAVTAISGVDSVINPVAAGGGSEAATNEEMLEIGPAQISHRDRAVTPEDFERLAHEASREVRKALCLPNRNAAGRHEVGWTSIFIVPASKTATPTPSLALRREVQRFLSERTDLTLVQQDHIFVGAPKYVPVSVEVSIVAKSFDVVASAEKSVRQKLEEFLHPLTGGPANKGWDFGRDLAASDLYALLEDINDVDHVATLRMVFGGTSSEERVEVEADALVASGTHKINMSVATENR